MLNKFLNWLSKNVLFVVIVLLLSVGIAVGAFKTDGEVKKNDKTAKTSVSETVKDTEENEEKAEYAPFVSGESVQFEFSVVDVVLLLGILGFFGYKIIKRDNLTK